MVHILLNENKETVTCGTDCLLWIDDRLSIENKKAIVSNYIKRTIKVNSRLKDTVYFAKNTLRSSNYNNPIKL